MYRWGLKEIFQIIEDDEFQRVQTQGQFLWERRNFASYYNYDRNKGDLKSRILQ
jgi:hypothetical protein